MSEKSSLDRAHELLIELAKSNALWLNYMETIRQSDMAAGIMHGDYLARVVKEVTSAYLDAETAQRTADARRPAAL